MSHISSSSLSSGPVPSFRLAAISDGEICARIYVCADGKIFRTMNFRLENEGKPYQPQG